MFAQLQTNMLLTDAQNRLSIEEKRLWAFFVRFQLANLDCVNLSRFDASLSSLSSVIQGGEYIGQEVPVAETAEQEYMVP